jgi:hypothetical protein
LYVALSIVYGLAAGSSRSLVQELVTLSTLRQQGTISEEEFQAAKRKLLA